MSKRKKKKRNPSIERHASESQSEEGNLSQPKNLWNLLIVPLFVLLGFLLYSNTFHSPFLLDDLSNIVENSNIRVVDITWDSMSKVLTGSAWERPIPMLSFALNYYFGRYQVMGYHVVNILIHVINGLVLFLFLKMTLTLLQKQPAYSISNNSKHIAFFAALLWFVHPLCTQSVTYISQRMNSMMAMFYILSFYLYVKGRLTRKAPHFYFISCAILGIFALLCKELAATLPFFIFLYEWYFFQDLNKEWLKRNIRWIFIGILPFIGIGIICLLNQDLMRAMAMQYSASDFTFGQRFLTEFRGVIYYLSLIFYPHPSRLNLDHDFPISVSLIDPGSTVFSLGIIMGLVATGFYAAKRYRLIAFCLFWYLGNLAIEVVIIPLFSSKEIIFEHRTYLPSMLISLLVVILIFRMIKHVKLTAALICIIALVFCGWTYQRNGVYHDAVSLWSDTVKKSPNKARPHNHLGKALKDQGKVKEAEKHYTKALQIDPEHPQALYNLGNVLYQRGRFKEAGRYFAEALRIKPDYANAHNNLGNALLAQGQLEEAFEYFTKALRINPNLSESLYNMGKVKMDQGEHKEATKYYIQALRINPDFVGAHYDLGNSFLEQGKFNDAIRHYNKVLEIMPDSAYVYNNLGVVSQRQGKYKLAINYYTNALRINPNITGSHYSLGVILMNQGNLKQAIIHFQEILRINPDDPDARENLKKAMELKKKHDSPGN